MRGQKNPKILFPVFVLLIASRPTGSLIAQDLIQLSAPVRTVLLPGSNRVQVIVSSTGSMFVLDEETSELSYLPPSGATFRAIGTAGAGPREYRQPTRLLLFAGDTTGVWDQALHRLLIIAPTGIPLLTIPAPSWLRPPADPVGADAQMNILFRVPQSPAGASDPAAVLVRWDVLHDRSDTITGVRPDPTVLVERRRDRELIRFVLPVPFQSGDQSSVRADGVIVVTRVEAGRLELFSPAGATTSVAIRPYERAPIEQGDIDSAFVWNKTPIKWPATKSPIAPGCMLLQGMLDVWVQRPSLRGETFVRYQSIGLDGQIRSELRLPVGSRLVGFGPRKELIVTRQERGGIEATLLVYRSTGHN
jgi:hypothetical protein